MKNLFLLLIVLAALAGCSDKYSSLHDAALPPQLGLPADTLFIREKDPSNINTSNKGILSFFCSPAGHQFFLSFSDTSGKMHFNYRGTDLKDSQPFVVTDNANSLYVYADAPGIYAVDFDLTDQLGKRATKKLIIKCAKMERPVAALGWQVDSLGYYNWQTIFNASASSQPFGMVMSYHYLCAGDTVTTVSPLMKYFFHVQGIHPVSFYVTDDLGVNSDTLHYTISIP